MNSRLKLRIIGIGFFCFASLQLMSAVHAPDERAVDNQRLLDNQLFEAMSFGDDGVINYLIDNGANINARDSGGRTPLMYVAISGRNDIVDLLIEKGANVNAQDNENKTALIYATLNDNEKVVGRLLEAKADPNLPAPGKDADPAQKALKQGAGPLLFAVRRGNHAIAQRLLEAGADPNPNLGRAVVLLSFAIDKKDKKMVELLVEAGAKISNFNPIESSSMFPIEFARRKGALDILDYLIDKLNKGEYADVRSSF